MCLYFSQNKPGKEKHGTKKTGKKEAPQYAQNSDLSRDHSPEVVRPVSHVSPVSYSDLSSAFQSLSVQSQPVAKIPSTITTYESAPVPALAPNPASVKEFPTFPLRQARCRTCGWVPKYRDKVSARNPNGNANRPYYICIRCRRDPDPTSPATTTARATRARRGKGWITWDDNIGISRDNRLCSCGVVSRQDRGGVDSYYPGGGFWTCATGACDYGSFRKDGLTDDEALRMGAPPDYGFEPWLL